MIKTYLHLTYPTIGLNFTRSCRICTVVKKLVIAIGEVVWTPETANMLKRLLNLVGVSRSTRLSYTLSSSSEYDQK